MSNPTSEGRLLRIAVHALLLAAVGASPAWAQEAADAAPDAEAAAPAAQATPTAVAGQAVLLENNPVITADAQAVLDRMQAAFAGMKSYSVTAQTTRDEMLPFGYKLQNTETARMWVQGPNRLRVEVDGDIKKRTYVYDGKQLTTFSPDDNVYAVGDAPDNLGELVSNLLDAGIEMPLIDMLYNGYTGNLASDVRVGLLVGESVVDGAVTDHLAFRQPNVDWQLWVDKAGLPRKMVITTRYAVGDPQYQSILRWDTKFKPDAKSFAFTPPSGAVKVPMRTKLTTTGGAQ